MKKILSHSKMRETMPLVDRKGKKRAAVFLKDDTTELSDEDYKYLNDPKNSMFPHLIETGVFVLVSTPDAPKLSKKEQKRNAKAAKDTADKAKTEAATANKGE